MLAVRLAGRLAGPGGARRALGGAGAGASVGSSALAAAAHERWWRRTIAQCARDFDMGAKGFLRAHEVSCAMTALLGLRPSRFEVRQIMLRLGGDCVAANDEYDSALDSGDSDEENARRAPGTVRGVALRDFEEVLWSKLRCVDAQDLIRQAFCAFDVGCRGFLTQDDALEGFRAVLPSISELVVLEAFKAADRDGDGRVGFAEFYSVMAPSSIAPPAFLD